MLSSEFNAHKLVDNWLHVEPNGDRTIIDPTNKQPLNGAIPAIVRDNPYLSYGLEVFREEPIDVELALGAHVLASHLDDPRDPGWFERTLRDPALDSYAYEGLRPSPFSDIRLRLDGFLLNTVLRGMNGDFHDRSSRALMWTRAVSGSLDPGRYNPVERVALTLDRCLQAGMKSRQNIREHPEVFYGAMDAFLVSQFLRESIMGAKMGRLMWRAVGRRQLHDEGDAYKQLVTLGIGHEHQAARLGGLGARVTIRRLPITGAEDDLLPTLLPPVMRTGQIPAQMLQHAHAHYANLEDNRA